MSPFMEAGGCASTRSSTAAGRADGELSQSGAAGRIRRRSRLSISRRADVDRVRNPADAFIAPGVPTIVCDPRELTLENGSLNAAPGHTHHLVYRRVLMNDILARARRVRGSAPGVQGRRSAWRTRSAASSRTRRHSSRCSRTRRNAATVLNRRTRHHQRAHSMDPCPRRHGHAQGRLARQSLLELTRAWREHAGAQAERRIRRQGRQARVGDVDGRMGRRDRVRAGGSATARGSCRSGFRCGAKCFRSSTARRSAMTTCWSTSRRICSAAAWAAT